MQVSKLSNEYCNTNLITEDSQSAIAMHPQFPFVLPKINALAPVPFRISSVSPAPIEAEKKINSQPINEKLLFSDFAAKAYKVISGKEDPLFCHRLDWGLPPNRGET